MTIPEAVLLVLQAAVLGKGGEVFMLDMGEPVMILNLARDLIELSGLEVGQDIEIVFTGMRPGEKLHEELFIPGESYRRTEHQKIFVIESATGTVLPSQLNQEVARLENATYTNNIAELMETLLRLLPDFCPVDEAPASDLAPADNRVAAGLPTVDAPSFDASAEQP